jgi:hypothetical protein
MVPRVIAHSRRRRAATVSMLIAICTASRAMAYEYTARAYSVAQAFQLRSFRAFGTVDILSRQRFTQSLDLQIWDLPGWQRQRQRRGLNSGGIRFSLQSSFRIDHDFGSFSSGRLRIGTRGNDALDVIPELGTSVLALEMLYGYLHVDGLWNDRVTIDAGRLVGDDGFEHFSVDGGRVHLQSGNDVSLRVTAGLRVREASPLGFAASELDGTTGADCREYVEASRPGTGRWQLIAPDRMIVNHRLASDFEYCPQRTVLMPMVDIAVASHHWRWLSAEVGYRQAWSSTVGLLGTVDRLNFVDTGYYPNESGQAPSRGTNQEVGYWHLHGLATGAGRTWLPYWDGRYSLLHHRIDRSNVGVRVSSAHHAIDASVQYAFSTFDGDSIFSIFVTQPALDARLAYSYQGSKRIAPSMSSRSFGSLGFLGRRGGARSEVRPTTARIELWAKRFLRPDLAPATVEISSTDSAAGVQAFVQRGLTDILATRISALYDDGVGGRRAMSSAELSASESSDNEVAIRATISSLQRDAWSSAVAHSPINQSLQLRGMWRPADYVGIGAIVEWNHNTVAGTDVRGWISLSLGYSPAP